MYSYLGTHYEEPTAAQRVQANDRQSGFSMSSSNTTQRSGNTSNPLRNNAVSQEEGMQLVILNKHNGIYIFLYNIFFYILLLLFDTWLNNKLIAAAGFTQDWSNNLEQRVANRQIAVQANNSSNPSEYRTVRPSTSGQQRISASGSGSSTNPMQEAQEESMYFKFK